MVKLFKAIIAILLFLLVCFILLKVNFYHYHILADERIAKVIKLQGAALSESKEDLDTFSYHRGRWEKNYYFKDDPGIRYTYYYDRSQNEVRVFGDYKNMSLDLANKKAKYPLLRVDFNGDEIGNIEEH